jgi:hypothetical protein
MDVKNFKRDRDAFFDPLVTLWCSLSSFNVAIESYHRGGFSKIPSMEDHYIELRGKTVDCIFWCSSIMNQIKNDSWPDELVMAYEAPKSGSVGNKLEFRHAGISGFMYSAVGSCFITYYESNKERVVSKFGENTSAWPDIWKFGRVVRNSIAHKGVVTITNARSNPVAWRGIQISANSNGQSIFTPQTLIGVGDVIPLMEEMDAVLI